MYKCWHHRENQSHLFHRRRPRIFITSWKQQRYNLRRQLHTSLLKTEHKHAKTKRKKMKKVIQRIPQALWTLSLLNSPKTWSLAQTPSFRPCHLHQGSLNNLVSVWWGAPEFVTSSWKWTRSLKKIGEIEKSDVNKYVYEYDMYPPGNDHISPPKGTCWRLFLLFSFSTGGIC